MRRSRQGATGSVARTRANAQRAGGRYGHLTALADRTPGLVWTVDLVTRGAAAATTSDFWRQVMRASSRFSLSYLCLLLRWIPPVRYRQRNRGDVDEAVDLGRRWSAPDKVGQSRGPIRMGLILITATAAHESKTARWAGYNGEEMEEFAPCEEKARSPPIGTDNISQTPRIRRASRWSLMSTVRGENEELGRLTIRSAECS